MKLGVIGCGQLARNIIKGFVKSSVFTKHEILVSVSTDKSKKELENEGWSVSKDNREVAEFADILILGCKSKQLREEDFFSKLPIEKVKLIVLLQADIALREFTYSLGSRASKVIRCIANIPSGVGAGMFTFNLCSKESEELAIKLFSPLGRCKFLDESTFDTVIALAASTPAFFALIVEAMIDGGVNMGLKREVSTELVLQSMLGSAQFMLQNDISQNCRENYLLPSILKNFVMTPGGCTSVGIKTMEEGNIRATLMNTIEKCAKKLNKQEL
jgi:pyrroline-5-carboxylate reductase